MNHDAGCELCGGPLPQEEAVARIETAIDVIGRSGAVEMEVGYFPQLDDQGEEVDVPACQVNWWAKAKYRGAVLFVDEHQGPWGAGQRPVPLLRPPDLLGRQAPPLVLVDPRRRGPLGPRVHRDPPHPPPGGETVSGEHFVADLGPCPSCGAAGDYHVGAPSNPRGDPGPGPGALSICVYCAAYAIVGDDRRRRQPTPRELSEIARDPGAVDTRGAVLRRLQGLAP